MVVAAPAIGRWQAFGNLFARAGDGIHRLDRHPTMSVHPVTPMHEADVTRHLAAQTARGIGLVDFVALKTGDAEAALERAAASAGVIALDVVDEETLAAAGALVWRHAERMFALGSQGLEYALVAHWRAAGLATAAAPPPLQPAPRVAVVSGSCSPVTADQIAHAETAGFAGIPLDATAALDPARWAGERARAVAAALQAVGEGRDPIVYTARGPSDPAVAGFRTAIEAAGATSGRRTSGSAPASARSLPRSPARRSSAAPPSRGRHLVRRREGPRPHRRHRQGRPRARRGAPPGARRGPGGPRHRDRAQGRADGPARLLQAPEGRRPARYGRTWRTTMTRIALLGAGGKMGVRLSSNLKGSSFEVDHVEPSEAGRQRLRDATGFECVDGDNALSDADVILMATRTGSLAPLPRDHRQGEAGRRHCDARRSRSPRRRAAKPGRRDLLRHAPCHPPIFNDENNEDRTDYFGGIRAKQHIVCALMQGPEEHYALCEEVAREIYKPVMRSHRVTVEQMAILEPALSETVGATLSLALKKATDEAVRRGVPPPGGGGLHARPPQHRTCHRLRRLPGGKFSTVRSTPSHRPSP
jgi:hypothetical protein